VTAVIATAASLSGEEVAETAAWLASEQLPSGLFPWYRGGHGDPWNHVEAAMALAAAGHWVGVERAFAWLGKNQLPDGSWCRFYVEDGVTDSRRDPNASAYVATGAWWCALAGGGRSFLEWAWAMVERGVTWCLGQQRPGGEVAWSSSPDGVPGGFALLAATCSVQHSLRSAARVAAALGHDRKEWLAAAERARTAVRNAIEGAEGANAFARKDCWAMDWYYPVLTGALEGKAARSRICERQGEFIEPGFGARCVSRRQWVTAAETAECSVAFAKAGFSEEASKLLSWTRHFRDGAGAYWTGCAHPGCARFPFGQRSTYSAAAVLIADHVLSGKSAAQVFRQ
jgi:hypothetical protein